MKNWKDCEFYQEMYDLRHTWHSMQCKPASVLHEGIDCKDCPLLLGVESEAMPPVYVGEIE